MSIYDSHITKEQFNYVMDAWYAPNVDKRDPNKEKNIIIGTLIENIEDLKDFCYNPDLITLFLLPVAFVEIFLISLPFSLFKRLSKYYKIPLRNYVEDYKLDKTKSVEKTESNNINVCIKQREKSGTLKDQYCPDKEKKNRRAEALINLRKHLFTNNFTLKVKKLPNGYYTFYNMNRILSNVFPELISLKTDFLSGAEWIENLNIEELEEKIKGMLQINIKIVYS